MAKDLKITSSGGISAAGGLSATGDTNYFVGNVGIGTATPQAPLQVTCNNATSTIIIHRDGSDPSTNTLLNRLIFETEYSVSTPTQQEVGSIDVSTSIILYTRY